MEVKSSVKGNTLEAKVTIPDLLPSVVNQPSSEIVINGAVVFQVKLILVKTEYNSNSYTNTAMKIFRQVFVKIRRRADNCFTYAVKFTSKELGVKDKCFTSDGGTWRLLYENTECINYNKFEGSFNLEACMEIVPSTSSFASLHEDTELTDFELRGEDGSVHVHRAVLAAASPVLRRMLGGAWREATGGHVDVPGTSSAALQHLKNYLYLHSLPDEGLEQLLLLAAYYIIPHLEQLCADKLVRSVTAVNACDMIDFAVKHKVMVLLLAVLEYVQSGAVSVTAMRDYYAFKMKRDSTQIGLRSRKR